MSRPDLPQRIDDIIHMLDGLSPEDISVVGFAVVRHGVLRSANIQSNTDAQCLAHENVMRAVGIHSQYCDMSAVESDGVA